VKIEKWSEWLDCGVWCVLLKKSKSFLYLPYGMPCFVGFGFKFDVFIEGK